MDTGLAAASSGHHPPLFHGPPGGPLPSEPRPVPAPEALQTRGPEFFQLEAEPSWLEGLRADLKDIAGAQRQMAKDMSNTSHELRAIQDGVRNLSVGQESLTRRADEQEAALQQMRREFQDLEREMQTLRSPPKAGAGGILVVADSLGFFSGLAPSLDRRSSTLRSTCAVAAASASAAAAAEARSVGSMAWARRGNLFAS